MNISINQKLFLLCLFVLTNSGGEGKTWLSMMLEAIFNLLNEDCVLIDADPGNRAASHLGATPLNPFGDSQKFVDRIVADLDGRKSLVIDAGANMLAASKEFEDMLRDTGEALAGIGYNVSGFWIVSTNKIGAAGSVVKAAKRMAHSINPITVFNDRDGSGACPPEIEPTVFVEYLQPGLVQLVNDAKGFAPIVQSGVEGHQLSADLIASYLWRFVNQPGVRSIFGDVLIDKLKDRLDREIIDYSPYIIRRPLDDAAIKDLSSKALFLRAVSPHYRDPEAAIAAIRRLQSS